MKKDDITNQQLLDALTQQLGVIVNTIATKEDLEEATTRLERKIDGNQRANTRHHLETRKLIGVLNKDFHELREGLARAARL